MKKFFPLLFSLVFFSCSKEVLTIYLPHDIMHVNVSDKLVYYESDTLKPLEFKSSEGLKAYVELITSTYSHTPEEEIVSRVEDMIYNGDFAITIYPTIDTNGVVLNPIGEVFLDYYNTTYDGGIKQNTYSKSIGYFCELVKHPLFENKKVYFTEAWNCN